MLVSWYEGPHGFYHSRSQRITKLHQEYQTYKMLHKLLNFGAKWHVAYVTWPTSKFWRPHLHLQNDWSYKLQIWCVDWRQKSPIQKCAKLGHIRTEPKSRDLILNSGPTLYLRNSWRYKL